MVQLTDTLLFDEARICADGCLVADVRAARTGIQTYLRSETDAPASFTGDQVRVYRPEAEVFSHDSMASFSAAPITIDHPTTAVDATNWKQLGVGEINGDVVRDGGFVRVPVIVRDAGAVEKVRTTHKQLSMGYSCSLDWTPGTAPDGSAYDAVQRDIRINHIAAVRAARGGPELKISDERPAPSFKEDRVKVINLDGLPVNLSDAAATEAAITTLDSKVTKALADVATGNDKLATLQGEKTALQTQLDAAKAAADPAALDKRVADRASFVALAKAAKPDVVTDGKSDGDIRKEIVVAKLGDRAPTDDAGIIGAFSVLTADVKVADSQITNIPPPAHVADATSVRNMARDSRYN